MPGSGRLEFCRCVPLCFSTRLASQLAGVALGVCSLGPERAGAQCSFCQPEPACQLVCWSGVAGSCKLQE